MAQNILIIKLGALGDFVHATAPIKAIRKHHKDAKITLLTTKGMLPFAKDNPNIDEIIIDERKKAWNLLYLFKLKKQLSGFDFVYDLQLNKRTSKLYYKLAGKPNWSGVAQSASHAYTNPDRLKLHVADRFNEQLALTGITETCTPDLSYMATNASNVIKENDIQEKFAILIPGCSPTCPEKRWPHYAKLAKQLTAKGIQCLAVGTKAEENILNHIKKKCPESINLCGKTSLGELVDLASKASFFVGNDTGPMHICAASGTKGIVLFREANRPDLHAPKQKGVSVISSDIIADINVDTVIQKLEEEGYVS